MENRFKILYLSHTPIHRACSEMCPRIDHDTVQLSGKQYKFREMF